MDIPDLYQQEEKDEIINECTKATKEAGLVPEPDIVWEFLCQEFAKIFTFACAFRRSANRFVVEPEVSALINSTVIDWFQPWPKKALLELQ